MVIYNKFVTPLSHYPIKLDPKPIRHQDSRSLGHITMPYVQGVSEVLNRKIRKSGVTVHPKPVNTIRSMLGPLRTNNLPWIKQELFTITSVKIAPHSTSVKLKDLLPPGSVNIGQEKAPQLEPTKLTPNMMWRKNNSKSSILT